MLVGVIQSSRNFLTGGSPSSDISNVVTNQTADQLEITFDINIPELNKPPSINLVTISGTPTKEEILTATTSDFYSESGYPEGTHLYQWYRADNNQSVGSTISGATNSTYTLTDSDVSKYIRCVVTPVQVGGTNDEGTPVTSIYTSQVQDNEFNPLTDISWFTAHTPAGATNLAGVGWVNYGTGNNSTQNGSDSIPTYVTDEGVDFEASSNQELVLDQPTPQFSMPVEIWIRCKFESFPGSWARLMDWNGAQLIEQRTSGAMYLGGGTCAYTATLDDWIVMRFVVSGTSNTSKFAVNNGTVKTNVAASTSAFGTSNGRIGANATGTGTRYDGMISHIFVKSGELTSEQITNMWDWFTSNAPWD